MKHIQRTAFLLYLIDISEWASEDPVESLSVLQRELSTFDNNLGQRPYAIIGTKLDLQGDGSKLERLRHHCEKQRLTFFAISSATREGLDAIVPYIGARLDEIKETCNVN